MAIKNGTTGNDVIAGTVDNDMIAGLGGHDILIGSNGDDSLYGGTGNDTLSGGAGNDMLDGGQGADAMEGGTGDDRYLVDDAGDVVKEAAGGGYDRVSTTLATYTLTANVEEGKSLFAGNAVMIGNTGRNDIYMGAGNDTAFGDAGNDFVIGNAGNDVLYGGTGNDYLYGGTGNDLLYGGSEDDTYFLDGWTLTKQDSVIEVAGGGYDTVVTEGIGGAGATGAAGEAHSYTLDAQIEVLEATGNFAFKLTGNSLDNYIAGGAYADTIDGGMGADTMAGKGGADTYIIDHAGDTVQFETFSDAAQDIARVTTAVDWTVSAGVEQVDIVTGNATIRGGNDTTGFTGSTGTDEVYGGNRAEVFVGNGGADRFYGGGGSDRFHTTAASAGATLAGGVGDDLYYIGHAAVTVTELEGEGSDTAYVSSDWVMGDHVDSAYVLATAGRTITGNAGDNWIFGNAGDDTLTGGAGNDLLDGGLGRDSMAGGTGDDFYVVNTLDDVVVEVAGQGTDTVSSNRDYVLGSTFENLRLYDAAIKGTGNALNNVIQGSEGDNILRGQAGDDTLTGSSGADRLTGGTGADVFVFDWGDNLNQVGEMDRITDFAAGEDRIDMTPFSTFGGVDFVGTDAFSNQSFEMRYEAMGKNSVRLLIDIGGDGVADMAIDVVGTTVLTLADFIL